MKKPEGHDVTCCGKELTLNMLLPGESGTIVHIGTTGPIRRRFMDMGIIEGVEVQLVRTAPFGDPVQIKVRNSHIAMRRSEAETITIHRLGTTQHARHHRRQHRAGRKS